MQERRHRRARNDLGRAVDGLERPGEHVRERREDATPLRARRGQRTAPHKPRLPVDEEAVGRRPVRERQFDVRRERETAVRLVVRGPQPARDRRRLREHRGDVEEVCRTQQDLARRGPFADVLQHAEQVLRRMGEPHARRRPQAGVVREVAVARPVEEGELRPHAAVVEVVRERRLVPRERQAHRHAVRRAADVEGGIDRGGAARGARLLLVLLLRLRVAHPAHQVEADGDDVRADHAEFLVRAAGAVRHDAPVGLQREAGGHVPAVPRRDLAGRLARGGVPVRPHHLSALREHEGLVEDLHAAPADQDLVRQLLRRHASASTKRAAFAATAASISASGRPRSAANA